VASVRPRVLYVQYANPAAYPPIVHGTQLLADAGAAVALVGTRPLVAQDIAMPARRDVSSRFIAERRGIGQKIAFLRHMILAIVTAYGHRPDWLYVSDVLGAPAGIVIAALRRTKVVYHEHDVPEGRRSLFMQFCLSARRLLARRADVVIAPSVGRADYLRETLGVAPTVVLNCPRRDEARTPEPGVAGRLRLVYQGTIVPQRLPLTVADAVGHFRGRVTLTIAGYETAGAEGYASALIARAGVAGGPGAIEHAGLITSRSELLAFCSRFDAGLAFMPSTGGDINMRTMAGASNKVFEYLACGIPVVVSDLSDWRAMFVDPGFAYAARPDDVGSLVALFERLLAGTDELAAKGRAGRERILSDWNYEHQFAPILARLCTDGR
jgi:glycosyltransferase involved in cell wall biosynthesis